MKDLDVPETDAAAMASKSMAPSSTFLISTIQLRSGAAVAA